MDNAEKRINVFKVSKPVVLPDIIDNRVNKSIDSKTIRSRSRNSMFKTEDIRADNGDINLETDWSPLSIPNIKPP